MKINYWADFEYGSRYHIYNKAPSKRELFYDAEDYNRFLVKYENLFSAYFITYAYCLMPNHFHFLVKVKSKFSEEFLIEEGSKAATNLLTGQTTVNQFIADQFRRFLSGTTIYLNKKYKMEGAAFRQRVKRVHVNSENRILELLCYIHHNPLHHGISHDYDVWPYTSYNKYLKNPQDKDLYKFMEDLGGVESFLEIHENYRDEWLKNAE